ncbi:hypothetical protein QYF61_011454 [Mycteria americana]|uniref:Integrase catalytic domain-containing protein n=1 Tax=Mycteria americana TaxID=33587 RepID=A0AAN7PEG1_MYCAM|nr:hypothetical protein QYF61_011454 [Mycteria americana]
MGRPGRSIISHSHKPAKASAMFLQWWKQPLDGWKHILCPMPPPRTLSWALKSKPYGDMEPQKELNTWAKQHGIEWADHIPYHAPAPRKIEQDNELLKTTLRAMGGGTFKHWDTHLAKATWFVNTRGSVSRAGPAQSKLLCTVEGDKVTLVHMKNMLGNTVWVTPALGKGKSIHGIAFAQGPECTWWQPKTYKHAVIGKRDVRKSLTQSGVYARSASSSQSCMQSSWADREKEKHFYHQRRLGFLLLLPPLPVGSPGWAERYVLSSVAAFVPSLAYFLAVSYFPSQTEEHP